MKAKHCLLLFVVFPFLWGCSKSDEEQKKEQASARKRQHEEIVAKFAAQFHAITNWAEKLPERGILDIFTYDVSHALAQTNGAPVLVQAELLDVEERNGNFVATFSQDYTEKNAVFTLRLLLACDEGRAQRLLHTEASYFAEYAIITKIDSVSRPALEISETETGEKYEVNFSSKPNVFIAKGTCVDVIPIGGTTVGPSRSNDSNSSGPANAVAFLEGGDKDRETNIPISQAPALQLREAHFKSDSATIKTATDLKSAGWVYMMPRPKSPQAAWGNPDGRTTWWVGYWANHRTQTTSSTCPVEDASGEWLGDNRGLSTWRRGGSPTAPSRIEWLCSVSGGIEPQ